MDAEQRTWLVVLGLIIGVPALLAWGCSALANDAAEQATGPKVDYSRRVDEAVQATLAILARSTPTARLVRVTPSPEDVWVQQFCSALANGELGSAGTLIIVLNGLETSELKKYRAEGLAVVQAVRVYLRTDAASDASKAATHCKVLNRLYASE